MIKAPGRSYDDGHSHVEDLKERKEVSVRMEEEPLNSWHGLVSYPK